MSTAAGLAIGLAAASAASSCESQPMDPETELALSIWLVGILVAFAAGGILGALVEWLGRSRWSDPVGEGMRWGLILAVVWLFGFPIGSLMADALGIVWGQL